MTIRIVGLYGDVLPPFLIVRSGCDVGILWFLRMPWFHFREFTDVLNAQVAATMSDGDPLDRHVERR
jgi:hypothetical protein